MGGFNIQIINGEEKEKKRSEKNSLRLGTARMVVLEGDTGDRRRRRRFQGEIVAWTSSSTSLDPSRSRAAQSFKMPVEVPHLPKMPILFSSLTG